MGSPRGKLDKTDLFKIIKGIVYSGVSVAVVTVVHGATSSPELYATISSMLTSVVSKVLPVSLAVGVVNGLLTLGKNLIDDHATADIIKK